jgi:hypothetical protein
MYVIERDTLDALVGNFPHSSFLLSLFARVKDVVFDDKD